MKLRLGLLAAAIAVAVAATATSALALVGGSPDSNRHPYVGMAIYFPDGNPGHGFDFCSGALVSPTVYVTAAHCFPDGATVIVDTQEQAFADVHQAGFGSAVPGVVHNHPRYRVVGTAPNEVQVDDVAVITLAAPISSPRYARLPLPLSTLFLPNNARIDNVGFGVQDAATNAGFGVRQLAQQRYLRDRDTPQNDLKISAGVACVGDSGGPNLLGGTDYLLAVNSFGPSADCSGVSYSQRLDTIDVALFLFKYLHQ
jgi:secreted trypsin-like serine protease